MTDDPSLGGADQEQPARGPGQQLKEQREALGLTLEQVAQELRILRGVLQSLEEDRFEVLEAPIFVRGHLRNYARLLNLPPEDIVAAYEETLSGRDKPELRLNPARGPAMDASTPGWVFPVAWLVVLAMLVMGALYFYAGPHRETGVAERETATSRVSETDGEAVTEPLTVEPVTPSLDDGVSPPQSREEPEALDASETAGSEGEQANEEARDPEARDEEAMEAGATAVDTDATSNDAASGDGGGTEETVQAEPELPDELVAAEPPPLSEVDPAEIQRLALDLEEDSWLEIYDADDRQLFYGLAAEGRGLELEGRAPISVFMGNAPAVGISVNGEELDFSSRIRRDNTARITIEP